MKIAIFGGSYNPIHKGHMYIAKTLTDKFGLDKFIFMVAGDPPHKRIAGNVHPHDRLYMTCIATDETDDPRIFFSDAEIQRGGISYTVDTMAYMRSCFPDDDLYLVVGADMLCTFRTWREPERILEMSSLIAVTRPETNSDDEYKDAVAYLRDTMGAKVYEAEISVGDISSSVIRQRVEDAMPVSEFVSEGVENYIYANALYQPSCIHYITLDLQKRQSQKRFRHSISTMREAIKLADRFGADRDKCRLAALIHDCEKVPAADALQLARRYGVALDEYETEAPGLIHAKLGAHMAQIRYGIRDPEILDAVAYHTTGAPYMTDVMMITYLADCTEATREYPNVDLLREAVWRDLREGMLMSINMTEKNLQAIGKTMHPRSGEAREWLMNVLNSYNS